MVLRACLAAAALTDAKLIDGHGSARAAARICGHAALTDAKLIDGHVISGTGTLIAAPRP